ncbi:8825_t:CDS:2, partial [Cetraspora pellucida]
MMHLGVTTTQCVEGAYLAMKYIIKTSESLTKSFNLLDRWLYMHYEEYLLQCENETQFTLNKIKNKLLSVTTYKASLYELRVNYNLPCQHIFPNEEKDCLSETKQSLTALEHIEAENKKMKISDTKKKQIKNIDSIQNVSRSNIK